MGQLCEQENHSFQMCRYSPQIKRKQIRESISKSTQNTLKGTKYLLGPHGLSVTVVLFNQPHGLSVTVVFFNQLHMSNPIGTPGIISGNFLGSWFSTADTVPLRGKLHWIKWDLLLQRIVLGSIKLYFLYNVLRRVNFKLLLYGSHIL